jgi:hypothetical protein
MWLDLGRKERQQKKKKIKKKKKKIKKKIEKKIEKKWKPLKRSLTTAMEFDGLWNSALYLGGRKSLKTSQKGKQA